MIDSDFAHKQALKKVLELWDKPDTPEFESLIKSILDYEEKHYFADSSKKRHPWKFKTLNKS